MNKIQHAFLTGFIKAATSLASPKPAIPNIGTGSPPNINQNSVPMKVSPLVNQQLKPVSKDMKPLDMKDLFGASESFSKPSVPYFQQNTQKNTANDNYNVNGMSPDFHTMNNSQGNTLNINAHGGDDETGAYTYQIDPSRMGDGILGSLRVAEGKGNFSPQQLAQYIGKGTNNINNIYALSCNEGGCGDVPTNANKISDSYATPANYKQLYPNATNVVQQPPGTVGALIPNQYSTNSYNAYVNMRNAQQKFLKDIGLVNEAENFSLPHQYNLQGGTNWVDKGPYINY